MKGRILSCVLVLLFVVSVSKGQSKVSGTINCPKPDPTYSIEVGDHPGHVKALHKQVCSYDQTTLGSEKVKDAAVVTSVDGNSTSFTYSGSGTNTTESGDKVFMSYKGASAMKEGKPVGDHGTWTYNGGTGKLKGIKGKGTFKTTYNADGSDTVEFEGEYELPKQ
jgi:hypothetical protein